ncbi:MAG: hypothetical protein WCK05_13475 [Planctomycetota bacterium]
MNRSIAWIALVGLVIGALAISGCKSKKHKPAAETAPAAAKPAEPAKEPAKEPMVEPAKEPVKEPVAEPAKEPVVEPAKAPVVEPAKEPVVEPAKPAAEAKTKTLWYDVKVGDMLKFKGMGNMTQVWEVTAVDDENATVNMTVAMPDLPGSPQQQKMPRWASAATVPAVAPDAKVETKDLGTEDITVSGKKLTCKVTQSTMTDAEGKQTVSKAWMCTDVPGGLVKTEIGGQVLMELVELKK